MKNFIKKKFSKINELFPKSIKKKYLAILYI